MDVRNKKKLKRLNLLEVSNRERIKLTKEVREKLRKKVTEAKLWQSLLEAGNLTINGNVVCESNQPLKSFAF